METAFAWSLCLSAVVVLLSIGPLTYGRVKAGYSAENMSAPRALFDELMIMVKELFGFFKIAGKA